MLSVTPVTFDVTEALSRMSLSGLASLETPGRHRGDGRVEAPPPQPAQQPSRRRARALPDRWTFVHVLDRLEEGYAVLARMPMATRPKQFGNSMPAYTYTWHDLVHQAETGELERLLRQQNRVRLAATPAEIKRMEQALAWSLDYLGDMPEVARAVGLGALWAAFRIDAERRCRDLGIQPRVFIRRQMHGVRIITGELLRRQVPMS